jgi:hypothetical protein
MNKKYLQTCIDTINCYSMQRKSSTGDKATFFRVRKQNFAYRDRSITREPRTPFGGQTPSFPALAAQNRGRVPEILGEPRRGHGADTASTQENYSFDGQIFIVDSLDVAE